jgi:hypothetical protein
MSTGHSSQVDLQLQPLLDTLLRLSDVFLIFEVDYNSKNTHITHVAGILQIDSLAERIILQRARVVQWLNNDLPVFALGQDTRKNWHHAQVETFTPEIFETFIRTRGNKTKVDNLGNLPQINWSAWTNNQ